MLGIVPRGKQCEVLALPAKGHIVVLGTAGSGKTTIALSRAQHLASLPGRNKVLLVTFNGALVEYMRGISTQICIAPDVLSTSWSGMIKQGNRPQEQQYLWPEEVEL